MLIYNVSTLVSWPVHDAWVKWMKEIHIPEVMLSGCFTGYRFVRVLETDETDGATYAVQYFAASRKDYDDYLSQHAPALRQNTLDEWGNQVFGFRSLMQVVN